MGACHLPVLARHPVIPDFNAERLWGLHSNIPACCVAWYLANILPEFVAGPGGNRPNPFRGWPHEQDLLKRMGYRPCETCAAGIRTGTVVPNVLHKCTRECIPVLQAMGAITVVVFLNQRFEREEAMREDITRSRPTLRQDRPV